MALSATLAGGLVAVERTVAAPLLWLGLLTHRTRVAGLIVSMLAMGAQIGMFYFLVQYLQRALGMDPLTAGLASIPEAAAIFTITRFGPRLVARIGTRPVLTLALAGLTVSYVWFAFLPDSGNYWVTVFPPLVLNGLAAGITFMPASALALTEVEPHRAGSASGLLQTAQQLGGAIGLAILVSIYAMSSVPGAFAPGLTQVFMAASIFTLTALGSVWILSPSPSRRNSRS